MASRSNSALGEDCSEAQASGCRKEEMVRNSGLNTFAAPYVPMQTPRTAIPAMNGYNPSYMNPAMYDSRQYQDVYGHDPSHNEMSNTYGNGVYSPYMQNESAAHLSMAYNSGQALYYPPGALMHHPNMYYQQRPEVYQQFHHEGGAREEGHPGSLNSTTPVCNNTTSSSSTSSSGGTSHPPPPWTSATSAATAAAPPLLSTPPVSANSDNSSFSHMPPRYFDHSMPKLPYSLQASGSMTPNKRQPDSLLFRPPNPPPANSMVTVQNCHVSVALYNNQPGSYAGETQHHPANSGAPLAHPPMNTSFAPPSYVPVCPPGVPLAYGMYNPAMDINYSNQGMQMRHQQPKSHRASTDARPSPGRGRGHQTQRGGSDFRRPRHSEGDRSSIGSNINRNSVNEDGCDFADADYNIQPNNEVDSHGSRTAMLDSNSGIQHHLEGSPLIINQAPHRYPNMIPYSQMRVVAVTQGLPLGINNAPQAAEEPARDSGCSSPGVVDDVSAIGVVSTSNSIPVSSPNLEEIASTARNGLAIDPSTNGPHDVHSNDVAINYAHNGSYSNNSLTRADNIPPYVPEGYAGTARDNVYTALPSDPSNGGVAAYPVSVMESSSPISMTETVPAYNMPTLCQSKFDASNIVPHESQMNHQSNRAESLEMPVQETPAVYTATVTAHHQPTHSSHDVIETISNMGMNGDQETSVAELDVVSSTHSASPSGLEQCLESPGSEFGDPKPIFETREEHNLSFIMTFGDLTRETIIQELEKNKTSLLKTKSRVETDLCSQDLALSITSSNPVFDTSVCSSSSNIPSALDFGTMSENEEVHTSRPVVRSKETVISENVIDIKPPSSIIDDVPCSPCPVTILSTQALSTNEVSTDFLAPSTVSTTTVSSGGPAAVTVTETTTVSTSTVLSHSVTAEKPPLPSAPKKPQLTINATARPVPAPGAAAAEPPAPSAGPPAPSAWGKNKNWKEEFKGNIGEHRPIKTAVIAPMIHNGVLEEDFATNSASCAVACAADAASPSSASEAHAATAMPPPPVDGTALKMDKIKVGGFLCEYKTDSSSVTLQPRGLTNKNYWCYSNTVLQALTAVPQFVNLYTAMQKQAGAAITPHTMPISHSIISYLNEFSTMNMSAINLGTRARKKTGQNIVYLPEVQLGDSFEPSSIQNMLLEKPGGQFMEGCQQDAEEMLSFLLNAIYDEFNECLKLSELEKEKLSGHVAPSAAVLPNGQTDESNDDWVTMGPKNKTCITRTTEFSHSPISEIFWGESRVIIKKGNSPVTNNLEPFITLPLDIQDENVTSVKEALHQFVSKADVAGYTCTDTQEELTVSSQRLLEQLPQVLILQLKRFVYLKDGGLQKVIKDISLSIDLEINKELISQQRRKKLSGEKVKYKLVSVIYHDGKDANKGHYVCNVYHPGYHCWLHYDDACVKPIVSAELQRCYAPRVPYLLFYRRADTFAEDTAPCAIQQLPNRRGAKNRRNPSADKVSCERPDDTETKPSNDGPGAPESHSRVSSVDRKPTSAERKVPEKSYPNLQKGNTKRQDKKQSKNKQVAKN